MAEITAGTIVIARPEQKNKYPVPNGTKGKVICVTGSGIISVKWEGYGSHCLLPDIDKFEIAEAADPSKQM